MCVFSEKENEDESYRRRTYCTPNEAGLDNYLVCKTLGNI